MNTPTNLRLEAITELLRRSSATVEEMARRTHIRRYFIEQLNAIQLAEKYLEEDGAVNGNIVSAAKKGFSVSQIALAADISREEVLRRLKEEEYTTGYREVDGCAGEFPSGSGYYYGVNGAKDDPYEPHSGGIVVIGSGAIRIAQGVEFDYCCVKAVEALRRRGLRAIMMNVNPETVSTDHDISDALYLEPLTVDDGTREGGGSLCLFRRPDLASSRTRPCRRGREALRPRRRGDRRGGGPRKVLPPADEDRRSRTGGRRRRLGGGG